MASVSLPSFRALNTAPAAGVGETSVPDMEQDEYTHYNDFINDSLNGSDSTRAITDYLDISDPEDDPEDMNDSDLKELYDLYGNSEVQAQPAEFNSVWNDIEFCQYLYEVMGMYSELSSDDSGEYSQSEFDEEDSTVFQYLDTFAELELMLPPNDSNTLESSVLEPRKEVLDAAIALGDCNFTTSRVNAHHLRWLLYGDDDNAKEENVHYEEVSYDEIKYDEVKYDENSESELREGKDVLVDDWLNNLCDEIENKLDQAVYSARSI
ncbi:hypothetical protein V8F20_005138 [Naviculisporaceae sp. PSN 640]